MGSIVLQAFISLDGVVQGGGGPGEDDSGGFPYGGWATDYDAAHGDADGAVVEEWESKTEALLLGRTTYEIWAGAWGVWDDNAPGTMGEFTRRYNRVPKYVASRTLTELGWKNSHLLGDDLPAAVKMARDQTDGELRIWGSTVLVRTLAEHDLIDEYRLITFPVHLGSGKRLFREGITAKALRLTSTTTTSTGAVIASYEPAGPATYGSFADES
jgi:dihydrofolate reductase